jgi:hypothetical protein
MPATIAWAYGLWPGAEPRAAEMAPLGLDGHCGYPRPRLNLAALQGASIPLLRRQGRPANDSCQPPTRLMFGRDDPGKSAQLTKPGPPTPIDFSAQMNLYRGRRDTLHGLATWVLWLTRPR